MLASDLNNPDFSGAVNPDSLLHVEFYMYEAIDGWASDEATYKEGRKITKKLPPEPFIRIMKPGDNTSIITTKVREEHKQRWPQQWLYFQMNEGLLNENIVGWKIEDWDHLKETPELLRELKYKRFYTVEQIAGMSDAQIQLMGIAGQGLKMEAQKALRQLISKEQQEENTRKDREIADMKERMAKMEEMLLSKPEKPKKMGRPKKQPQTAPLNG